MARKQRDPNAPDKNTWATPPRLFSALHDTYRFTVDACALPFNTKLPRFWSPADDGLAQSWAGERVWCNPPYGRGPTRRSSLITPWVAKSLAHEADLSVLLLPARTEMDWFQELWAAAEDDPRRVKILFLPYRVKMVPPPGIDASTPMERSLLAVVLRSAS